MVTTYRPQHMTEDAAKEWEEIQNRKSTAANNTVSDSTAKMGPVQEVGGSFKPISRAQMTGASGIRDTMVNKYNMDNSKIGYDNGTVTYDGKAFMTPNFVENNTSYASDADILKAYNAHRESNSTVPVRETLTKNGYINDYIDYNDGNITYSGKNVISPGKIVDGVSYVTQEEMDSILDTLSSGNVNAAEYMSSKGFQNSVQWNNDNTVTILGQTIPVARVVSDGKNTIAQVPQSQLDRILDNYSKNNPTLQSAYKTWQGYGGRIENALDEVLNQEAFSYDLESDINYQAAKAAAERQGQAAFEDTLGRAAALSGGYANSAAIAAAAAAQNHYLSEFQDNVPQFYENAYNRYISEKQEDRNRLAAVLGAAGEIFGTESSAALAAYDLINSANLQNYARRDNEWKNMLALDEMLYNRWADTDDRAYRDRVFDQSVADGIDDRAYRDRVFDQSVADGNSDRDYRDRVFEYQKGQDEKNWNSIEDQNQISAIIQLANLYGISPAEAYKQVGKILGW